MTFLCKKKRNSLDKSALRAYTPAVPRTQGYGVIGNTSVSGTAIRGSSPCSPTEKGAQVIVRLFCVHMLTLT